MNNDTLQRFVFGKHHIRGEIVHLDQSVKEIMEQHAYPLQIRQILSEVIAASVLLSATIKFNGQLTIQFQDPDGPIKMMVAKCTNKREIRAVASWDQEALPASFINNFQSGQLVITIDDFERKKQYQSIVAINQQTIAHAIETFFLQSEQLVTKICLAVNSEHTAGLMLQSLPVDNEAEQQQVMETLKMFTETLKPEELFHEENTVLLQKLYAKEDIQLFDAEPVCFKCTCSHEKMAHAIKLAGKQEAQDILLSNPYVNVVCEYCNNSYDFSKDDVNKIFE